MTDHFDESTTIGTRAIAGLGGHQVEEAGHGRLRVEHGLVHVHVDRLGAALHLAAGDLQRGVEVAVHDPAGEGARAGDIRPLADVHEQAVLADGQGLEPGQAERRGTCGDDARGEAASRFRERRHVRRSRAAAAADHVDQARLGELAQDSPAIASGDSS